MNMREEKNGAVLKVSETCEVSTIVHVFLFLAKFLSLPPLSWQGEKGVYREWMSAS